MRMGDAPLDPSNFAFDRDDIVVIGAAFAVGMAEPLWEPLRAAIAPADRVDVMSATTAALHRAALDDASIDAELSLDVREMRGAPSPDAFAAGTRALRDGACEALVLVARDAAVVLCTAGRARELQFAVHAVVHDDRFLAPAARGPAADARPPSEDVHTLALTAPTPAALLDLAARTADRLAAPNAPAMADVARTAGARHAHPEARFAYAARTRDEWIAALRGLSRERHAREGQARVVFVFSGQGSQWAGMARRLVDRDEAFRACMVRCSEVTRASLGWSALDVLRAGAPELADGRAELVQPLLVATQIALAEQWRAWGVTPAAVVGQSLGEVSAAAVAGVLSVEEAMRMICLRATLVRRLRGTGAMALVELTAEKAEGLVRRRGDGHVTVATLHGPSTVVLSGPRAALEAIGGELAEEDVFFRFVDVDYASHGPDIEPLVGELRAGLTGLAPRPATVPFYSTATPRVVLGETLDVEYWARNERDPVLLCPTIERLMHAGFDTFVEVSPHPVLLPSIERVFEVHGRPPPVALPTLRRDDDERMRHSLAHLFGLGRDVDWRRLAAPDARIVRLPVANAAAAMPDAGPRSSAHESSLAWRDELHALASPAARLAALEQHVAREVARTLDREPSGVPHDRPLSELGLDSLRLLRLRARLADTFAVSLSTATFFRRPTVRGLAEAIGASAGVALDAAPDVTEAAPALARRDDEPIAVVGLACRFPGASSPAAFWQLLLEGRDAIREVPRDRWDVERLAAEDPSVPPMRWGGFLEQIDRFEPSAFGLSPREAAWMDPQQRLVLEVAWEALEDAGIPHDRIAGSSGGVFLGVCNNDHARVQPSDARALDTYAWMGASFNMLAGRVAYLLDLRGPAVVLDTACSSSLVALHYACEGLRSGEARIALAGGVNLMLSPSCAVSGSRMGLFAADGRCKAFDARADGMVRGEGCGVVVLKRLSDAIADGDRVLAVVRASGINQDGRSNGLTAPNGDAQRALLRAVMARAGVSPGEIRFVETHGTGTALGDPVELDALRDVLGAPTEDGAPCVLGAVKTNIGHLESAAGVAGFIKTILALHHETIPANLHFQALNPHVSLDGTRLAIPSEARRWARGPVRRVAGVSAFGWSGTNAHAILEEAPAPERAEEATEEREELVPLSARSPEALRALARELAANVDPDAPAPSARWRAPLAALAYTAGVRRAHHAHRLAVVARTHAELAEALRAAAEHAGEARNGSSLRVAFAFPGQGSQWQGMGRSLLAGEPTFRAALERADAAIARCSGPPVLDLLSRDQPDDLWRRVDVVQPLLFAMQVALAETWRAWGIEPHVVVGHSLGEIAAAFVAGALDLADAARVICVRSRLVQRVCGRGAMALVEQPRAAADALVAPHEGRVVVAAENGPRTVLLAGDRGAVDQVVATAVARGVFARRVDVDYASHCDHMDPLAPELLEELAPIRPRPAPVPICSTVLAAPIDGGSLDAEYWARNLRQPVLFHAALDRIARSGIDAVVEVSPHPVLLPSIAAALEALDARAEALPTLRRNEPERGRMLDTLGRLYERGARVEWSRVASGRSVVPLPTTPWQRERCALEAEPAHAPRRSRDTGGGAHPVLDRAISSSIDPGAHLFEGELRATDPPWPDHRVRGRIVLPGAALLDLAVSAARVALGNAPVVVERVAFREMLELAGDAPLAVQVALERDGATHALSIASRPAAVTEARWRVHATAIARPDGGDGGRRESIDALVARCTERVEADAFYRAMSDRGIDYGPAFRGVRAVNVGPGEAVAELAIDESAAARHAVSPALLDAAFQALAALLPEGTHVPVSLEALRVVGVPGARAWGHAVLRADAAAGDPIGDVSIFTADGELAIEARGLGLRRLAQQLDLANRIYEVEWVARPATPARPDSPAPAASPSHWVVLGDERGPAGALADALRARGASCAVVTSAEDAAAYDARAFVDVRGVGGAMPRDALELARRIRHRATDALALVQAIARRGHEGASRVWLVTQGAQPVGGGPIGLRDAALAGLARVVAHEHPELRCACVDVDLAGPVDVNALADALLQDDDEDLVALRAGARHVARFAPAAAPEAGRVAIASDATYWITGAFGGLGLLLARWLVDRGARHLVLTGRRAPSQAAEGVLAELRARGANIVVELADVSRDDEVAAVVDRIARTMPPLRGVAHAPLVLDDGLIAGQTPERVAKVFAPKVDGALLVDAHTRGATLDWFLLFSSVASVLGLPGQVGYAAANSVLDALAHARRREGLAAIAINWGPWSDIGAAAADDMRGARLATRGMEGLSPAEGLVALEALLADARPQVAVVELRRGTWRDAHGKLARLPYFAAIGRDAGPGANPGDARRALEATPAGERRRRLEAFVRAQVAGVLRLSSGRVALDAPFAKLGFDSLTALELRNRLEAALDLTLPATLVWTHRSLVDLASYLADRLALDHAEADRAAPQAHPAATAATSSEPIAIVGMACRFPGGANDPDAFWRLLDAGVDAVREVPRDRWDADAYYDRDVAAPGKMNSRWGGFLDRVDTFDAEFFGISPREAACLDPQQRLWLEVAWEALEDAGQPMDRVVGTRTGVFLGMSTNDYARLLEETAAADDAYAITGNSASFASGRLSYLLDLRGPSVVVDTACSSSLVALDLAVQSLRSGRCDRALAGGVNLILSPATSVLTSKLHALSPEGRCKTFDASADGFVRGEGCGAVVLKRLSDARRDGDRVLALVRATAVNQDGESAGLTAPSVRAQSALVAQALAEAGVTSDDVGYLEAHGTGTQLGDPIEVDALKAIFFARDAGRTCALGSVKTNIGHLEAAAGIAGLLKVVLALRHERIPRHLHFQRLNPHIDLEGSPFAVAVDSLPWKRGDRRRIAGVSSFGMSGTNAHVVLEEAPFEPPPASHVERSHHLLVLSSKTPDGLRAQAERYADFLRDEERLADVAHTASTGRAHYDERFAVVAATSDEARARLAAFARGEAAGARGRAGTPPKIAFVFTGQGSQYAGMGRTLYETQPIFRAALDRCAEIARPLLGLPLLSVMFAERGASPLDETEYTQPVIFALEYALAEMWRAWGVQPDGVLGHSVGEFAAACVAGALDVEHAMRLVATRGRLMQRLPRDGAMASVRWPAARVIDAVKARAKDVSLAAINGADQTVVSGRREAVQALCDELAARGAKTKPLDVSHAFHSALMDPILAELEEAAKSADLRPPRIALVSNVTGEVAGEELSQAAYWSRHARQPVRFSDGIKALAARGVDAYLEIGPQPTLLGMSAAELGDDALKLASLRKGRDEWPVVLESLGLLHVRGAAIDWSAFDAPYARRRLGVPTYAFQRRRHWVDGAGLRQGRDEATGHPLLGTGIRLAGGGWLFRTELAGAPYLAEHRVFGEPVLAAAAYLELCHAAARHRYGEGRVCGLVLESPLVLAEDGTAHVQIALSDEGDAGARVRIYSETTHGWTLHAEGSVRAEARSEAAEERREAIVSRCAREVDVEDTYATLSGAGFSYGAPFRGVRVLRAGDGESYAELALAGSEAEDAARYGLHPALLDAALQALAVLLESAGGAYMPFEIGEYRVCAPGARAAWVHARLSEGATGDVRLFDAGGALVAEVLGLRLKRGRPRSTDAESMYTLDWREQGLAGDGSNPRGTWIVMEPAAPTEHAAALRARFARAGVACRERIDGSDPIDGVVCVWPAAPGGAEEAEARAVAALKVVQELVARGAACSRLWWITEGAQSVAPGDGAAIESASLWGLGRVVMAEHPELRCTLLDVESWDASLPDLVWRELAHADDENQVAYRAGKRHVARLVRAEAAKAIELPDAPSYRLEIGSRGQLDRLRLAAAERRAPGPGEVEIAVRASGVNFRDVLNALGMYPGDAGVLGAECAGTVTAVGAGVAHLRAGDEVMALARGEFAPYVTVDARLVAPKPAAMAWEEAASTPVAFLTAWYALRDLGALTRGERVLVHAAAGGVGMAAVQIARWLGAEVFATASRPKWALVASMGVAHVADSRSTAFVEELRGKTGGGGFDVVLDALTGELVDAGLSLVKRGGRFLEMGKLDVRSPSEVAARYPGVHYRAFDLLDVPPERIAQMLAELGEGFARGDLRALPVRTYRVTEAEDAFRFMAQGRHVGKIALAPADVEAGPRLDGTVLVTGGLGALGLHVARWLARERRASHLLLVGRSAPSAQQDAAVEELRATGCEVTVARADVSRASDVDAVLASIPADRPLRGVVHAAGVLADGVLLEQDASGFARVFAPKVKGAWNLHERTLGAKLDFFVLFSSLSGLVGNAGQASYAAANAFLDALAHLRRARGLPALSLDWGTWSGAGMANALDGADQARLARAGIGALEAHDALELLGRALTRSEAQLALIRLDIAALRRSTNAHAAPLWRALAPVRSPAPRATLASRLAELPAEARRPEVEATIRREVAKVLSLPSGSSVPVERPLKELGVDSLMAVELRNALSMHAGAALPASLVFDYPTVAALSEHLLHVAAPGKKRTPAAMTKATRAPADESIAIVGMSCRFPGAADPDELWELLRSGRDAITEVPRGRWNVDAFYDPDPDAAGKIYTRAGGFLPDVDRFDAALFGIAPREALSMDPQQRLLLEVTWEALERAGISAHALAGSASGVFVGICSQEYGARLLHRRDARAIDAYAGTGNFASVAAGRLSYVLGLAGPAIAVDTACSSSLVTVHLASQSLRDGECDLALAGGVNLLLSPEQTILFSRLRALSPDGRCKAFDARANGYVRAEGCGVVVLKRLSDALRDGDRVFSVIRGSAVNQDGRSNGLTAPNGPSQQAVIRRALAQAGVDPSMVGYVEAHGTGTPLGDPIELHALGAVLGEGRPPDAPVVVGTIKTNIGHTEAAAGVAGLIKAVLALTHEEIPPNLHFATPSPHIAWDGLALTVATAPVPWKRGDRRRIAGVSSFGISGTNAHVVLEEAPIDAEPRAGEVERPAHVLPLSSKTAEGLRAQALRYAACLGIDELADVAHTAGAGRAHHDERLAVVAATSEEARARLEAFARGEPVGLRGRAERRPRVAFLFTGQGSQYTGMGRELYETQPVFRAALDRCAATVKGVLREPLLSVMFAEGGSTLDETAYAQPALFALEYALAEMWRSWGIEPEAVLGHSVGEYAAACVAGVLSVEDAMLLLATRGRLMQELPKGDGAMASVRGEPSRVFEALKHAGEVSLAAINSADQVVISGPRDAVRAFCDELQARGSTTKLLEASRAFHSSLMDPILGELERAARGIELRAPRIALVSNVSGELAGEEVTRAEYFSRHARGVVRFADGMKTLSSRAIDAYVEIGPQPTLLGMVAGELGEASRLPSLRKGRPAWSVLLESVGGLYVQGAPIDWRAFDAPYSRRRVTVPTYAFQRERYWLDTQARPRVEDVSGHPLLGSGMPLAGTGLVFEAELATYLAEHRVFGEAVLPATAYLELAHAAAVRRFGGGRVSGLVLQAPLVLAEDGNARVQVVVSDETEDRARVRVYGEANARWTLHAEGSLHPARDERAARAEREPVASRCAREVDVEDTYAALASAGLGYGEAFRGLRVLRAGDAEAYAEVSLAEPLAEDAPRYGVHPALLDAALQAVGALLENQGVHLPFEIGDYRVLSPGARAAWVHAQLSDGTTADVRLFDGEGAPIAEVSGVRLQRGRTRSLSAECIYRVAWREQAHAAESRTPRGVWVVLEPGGPTAHAAPLRARLASAGATCRDTIDGDGPIEGVVCLWGAGGDGAEDAEARCVAALRLVQRLVAGEATCARLCWVTEGAQSVVGDEGAAAAAAALWGLGRVVMAEHPELRCTLVDLNAEADAVDALWHELSHADDEAQIAWRAGKRHVARLVRAAATADRKSFDANAGVLITGGLGALGAHVARWLVEEKGVRRLVLAGRGAPSDERLAAIEELRRSGARITVARANVADRRDVDALVRSALEDGPLQGVIHLAGALADGVLAQQDEARMAEAFAAKARGAWNLHQSTRALRLDFFVLFSSAASLFGNAGQGAYAAANAFLDGLAHTRRAQGLAAQSLDWGPWSDGGLADTMSATSRARLARRGVRTLSPRDALELLDSALCGGEPQLALLSLDAASVRASDDRSLLRTLFRAARPAPIAEKLTARLSSLAPEARAARVEAIARAEVAKVLSLAPADLPLDRPLQELGLDSLMAVELRNALSVHVGERLPATLVFDHPTLGALARHLLARAGSAAPSPSPAPAARPAAPKAPADEPIAIVGVGCRFPGGVRDLETFWRMLDEGRDGITEMPRERWDVDELFDANPDAPGKMTTRSGGFLSEIDRFDASFFGIAPREAAKMDPQQRLLLEVSWEALEHAGIPHRALAGTATGVFVGLMYHEYQTLAARALADLDGYVGTGSLASVASGRISYLLGLQGPSLTVDTACSSSLVTVHLAAQSLRGGECDVALAGGVTLMLTPTPFVEFSRLRGLAADGRCKSFDASADGVAWSEGCGVLVLKRLSSALRDGDRVLALVRGSAVNQDGRSNGLTAPNGPAQEVVVRRALEQAGVAPWEVGYVEAHGTGTPLGDPIEVQALGAVLASGRDPARPVLVGSVKSNIGHTQAAAGVAGVIKAALALEQRRIPRSLHVSEPNPRVAWNELPVTIAREALAWPAGDGRRIAGVSAFGISGTNAHVVLESAPRAPEPSAEAPQLLLVSAKGEMALRALASDHARHLRDNPDLPLADACFTSSVRRSHHEHRLALVADSRDALLDRLDAFARGEARPRMAHGVASERPSTIAFVFAGQGGQWPTMGRSLLDEEPVFRDIVERCDRAMREHGDFSIRDVLCGEGPEAELGRVDVVQPALFAMQVGLAATWRSWGVEPAAVVGHSMGEIAAACVAGALSIEDGCRVVCVRSRLVSRVTGRGAMALVELPPDEARAAIAGEEHAISVAAENGPRSTILSGERAALERVFAALEARGVFCRWVNVDYASHSPQMDALTPALLATLADLHAERASIPLYSTVTGDAFDGPLAGSYWKDNLREPVRFWKAVEALARDGVTTFLEVNAHPTLLPSISDGLRAAGGAANVVASMRRDDGGRAALLASLGQLHVLGHDIDWKRLFPRGGRVVSLPSYAWQRERHWFEARPEPRRADAPSTGSGHAWLGPCYRSTTERSARVWQGELRVDAASHLREHRVAGAPVVAGAVWLEAALHAARSLGMPALEHVELMELLPLGSEETTTVQLVARASGFELVGAPRSEDGDWTLHARGRFATGGSREPSESLDEVRARCPREASGEDFYDELRARGLEYDGRYAAIERVWMGEDEAVGALAPRSGDRQLWVEEPWVLDACLQVLGAAVDHDDETYVPVRFERVELRRPLQGRGHVHAKCRRVREGALEGDVRLLDDAGEVVFEARGVHLQRVGERSIDRWLYGVAWEEQDLAREGARLEGTWIVLSDGPLGAAVIERMQAAGARCVRVAPGREPDFAAALRDAPDCAGVVHLAAAEGDPPTSLAELQRAQERGCASALALAKRILEGSSLAAPPRLWLVTRATQSVLAGDFVHPAHATVWGFARALAHEHPEARCTCVDLAERADALDLHALVAAIAEAGPESQIALRGGKRFVARLARGGVRAPRAEGEGALSPEASYLVTGGLGGLGLEVAHGLARRGARRLVLLGRSAPGARARRAIDELTRQGVRVQVLACDVAREGDVARALESIPKDAPLRGVVHAAGLLDDATVLRAEWAQVANVFAPKVHGAWNLHASTRHLPLDFFVLFSSAAAVLGSAGQAAYAAANAFLDALAHHRRAAGLPALTIDWGAWSEVGLAAARDDRGARLDRRGVRSLSPEQGMLAFDTLLGSDATQAMVVRLDARRWRESYPHVVALPFFTPLMAERGGRASPAARASMRRELEALDPLPRRLRLEEYLRSETAHVLRLPRERIHGSTPFASLGFDSLMAIELRNRLDAALELTLPASIMWSHRTVEALALHLAERMGLDVATPRAAVTPAHAPRPLETLLESISEEDAEAALLAKLEALEEDPA